VMLGVLGSMLAGFVGFGFYIYKHATRPIPPHIKLAEEMGELDAH